MGRRPKIMSLKAESSNPSTGEKGGREIVLGIRSWPSSKKEGKQIQNLKQCSLGLNTVQNTEAGVDDGTAYKEKEIVEPSAETIGEESLQEKLEYLSRGKKRGLECVPGQPNSSSSKKNVEKEIPNVKQCSPLPNAVNCPPQNQSTEAGADDGATTYKEIEIVEPSSETNMGKKSLEEKVEYLFKQASSQEKMIEGLVSKFKIIEGSIITDHPGTAGNMYKRFYEESKTMNETLIAEKVQLFDKLEETFRRLDAALGKVVAYEKMNNAASEMMDKLKDVIFYSNLTRAPEAELNPTSQAGCS